MGGKAGKKADDNKNKPWVSNYPPLHDFLREIDARCDWQIPYGPARAPTMYVEQWRAPGAAPFIIVVYADQHGWNIFTATLSEKIDATIEDVKRRIYYPKPAAPSSGLARALDDYDDGGAL